MSPPLRVLRDQRDHNDERHASDGHPDLSVAVVAVFVGRGSFASLLLYGRDLSD